MPPNFRNLRIRKRAFPAFVSTPLLRQGDPFTVTLHRFGLTATKNPLFLRGFALRWILLYCKMVAASIILIAYVHDIITIYST
jgi:hypothetical protein